MKGSLVRTVLAAAVLLASASAARAQQADSAVARRPGLYLLPTVGSVGGTLLGWEPGGTSGAAWTADARVLGLGAEVRTPVRGVDLRAGLTYSRPRIASERGDGSRVLAHGEITTLTVDAVVRGPRLLDFQPYVLGGVGLRHYNFKSSNAFGVEEAPLLDDQLTPVLEFGAGVKWDVGRYDLFVEISQQYTYLKNSAQLETTRQSDNGLRFGVRIPIK